MKVAAQRHVKMCGTAHLNIEGKAQGQACPEIAEETKTIILQRRKHTQMSEIDKTLDYQCLQKRFLPTN